MHQKIPSYYLRHAGLKELIWSCEKEMNEASLRIPIDPKLRNYWRHELRASLHDRYIFKTKEVAEPLVSEMKAEF